MISTDNNVEGKGIEELMQVKFTEPYSVRKLAMSH